MAYSFFKELKVFLLTDMTKKLDFVVTEKNYRMKILFLGDVVGIQDVQN